MRGKVTIKLKNKKSETNNDSTLQEPLARKSEDSGTESLNIIVLDSAQTKFSVKSDPEWTVAEFKQAGRPTVSMRRQNSLSKQTLLLFGVR